MTGAITTEEVLDFMQSFEETQASQQFERVAPLVHPDALFRFNDGDYRGMDQIRGAFEATWAHDVKDERYYLTDIQVESTEANSATATFTFHWSGEGPEGPFHVVGRGTNVIVRHEGTLKVLVEHLSR